jgi:hypothetical protein
MLGAYEGGLVAIEAGGDLLRDRAGVLPMRPICYAVVFFRAGDAGILSVSTNSEPKDQGLHRSCCGTDAASAAGNIGSKLSEVC